MLPVEVRQIYHVLERSPIEVLHGVVEDSRPTTPIVINRDDVRVVELARQLHFALEALKALLIDLVGGGSNLITVGRRNMAC